MTAPLITKNDMRIGFWCWLAALMVSICSADEPAPLAPADAVLPVLQVDLDRVRFNDFLGVNAVYHGFAWMPEVTGKGFDDTDRTREFDRVSRMKLQIARTWYSPDWAAEKTGIAGPYDWESPKMKAFYRWLDEMKARKVDVALQAGWGFPAHTHWGRPGPDPEKDPAEFSRWVSESVHQLVQVRGYDNIKYLILMTEPTTSPWGGAPQGWELWPYYVKVMRTVHERMTQDGTRNLVKFVGPNNHGVGSFEQMRLSEAAASLNDVLDIYSAHTYLSAKEGHQAWLAFFEQVQGAVAKAPKPVWLDEYNASANWVDHVRDRPEHGTWLAEVVAASLDGNIQTSMIWILFDQMYPAPLHTVTNGNSFYTGVHRWGTTKWPHDEIDNPRDPYPAWYAYAMMSRYLGGGKGSMVPETKGAQGLLINAVRQPDGEWSLMVINTTTAATSFRIQLSRPLNRRLDRHSYDPAAVSTGEAAAIAGVDRSFDNVAATITDSLPAGAVAIYVSSPAQPMEKAP